MNKEKILLDTDIGSDIDDCITLSYLLAQPVCELLGITTVTGEPHKRASLADWICSLAKRQIPVLPGNARALDGSNRQPDAPLVSVVNNNDKHFPKNCHIEFMRETICNNPGEITLLGIGPLTNIAELFTVAPRIPCLLKKLVIMNGIFYHQLPGLENFHCEWNASVDPKAASIVYETRVPDHQSIGMDVTCQVTMNKNEARKRFDLPLLENILPVFDNFTYHKNITFHDPLAALTIFYDICQFRSGFVEVETRNKGFAGKTVLKEQSTPWHHVAFSVDTALFFEKFFETFHTFSS